MGDPLAWTGTRAITSLRKTIADPSGATVTRYTDAALGGYLDEAQFQVVTDDNEAIETTWTVPLATGVREYAMDLNFLKARSVRWDSSSGADKTEMKKLEFLRIDEYDDLYGNNETIAGEPLYFHLWRSLGTDQAAIQPTSMLLHPVPPIANNGQLVWIKGYKWADSIATDLTKICELPPTHIQAMLTWAVHTIFLEEDDPRADSMLGKYKMMIRDAIEANRIKDMTDRPRINPRETAFIGTRRSRPRRWWRFG